MFVCCLFDVCPSSSFVHNSIVLNLLKVCKSPILWYVLIYCLIIWVIDKIEDAMYHVKLCHIDNSLYQLYFRAEIWYDSWFTQRASNFYVRSIWHELYRYRVLIKLGLFAFFLFILHKGMFRFNNNKTVTNKIMLLKSKAFTCHCIDKYNVLASTLYFWHVLNLRTAPFIFSHHLLASLFSLDPSFWIWGWKYHVNRACLNTSFFYGKLFIDGQIIVITAKFWEFKSVSVCFNLLKLKC